MDCTRFVIRDMQQERHAGLPKSCQVGIGRYSGDQIEVIERVRKFRHDLFWSHPDPAKMVGPPS